MQSSEERSYIAFISYRHKPLDKQAAEMIQKKIERYVVPKEFREKMEGGLPILDTVTLPCEVKLTGKSTFHIVLHQGLNRQIRRMCEYLGYRVVKLKRIRILNISLGSLPVGQIRELTPKERKILMDILQYKGK